MTTAALYYEAHVTIDPVAEAMRPFVDQMAQPYGFKLAKLLMEKGRPSELDTFMTAHGRDLDDIKQRTAGLVRELQVSGHRVRRYKIEDTVLDSRTSDDLNLLTDQAAPVWERRA